MFSLLKNGLIFSKHAFVKSPKSANELCLTSDITSFNYETIVIQVIIIIILISKDIPSCIDKVGVKFHYVIRAGK